MSVELKPAFLFKAFLGLVALGALAFGALRVSDRLGRPPEVAVAEIREEPVTRLLAVTGRVRARARNRLAPLVSGRLAELAVEEGDRVTAGQVVARLDDRPQRKAVEAARAEASTAEEELAQARRDLERVQKLADEGLLPPNDLETARLRVQTRRETLRERGLRIEELKARLEDYVLRSPVDGWVLERPVDPGQTVGPGDVVVDLATDGDPWVEAEVDERYLAELRPGLQAVAAPLAGRRTPWPMEVVYVGRSIDRLSGAAVIRLAFEDEEVELPVGLSLDVNLVVEALERALTVPRTAVLGLGERPEVRLAIESPADGEKQASWTAETRSVEVIDWPAERLVVVSGLHAGDRVVVEPWTVPDGAAITPVVAADALEDP